MRAQPIEHDTSIMKSVVDRKYKQVHCQTMAICSDWIGEPKLIETVYPSNVSGTSSL